MAALSLPGRRGAALALLALTVGGCSRSGRVDAAALVGKWRSSRLTAAPIHLRTNGDWEIRTEDGALLQYGIWELEGSRITWSYKRGGSIEHDVNEVLSVEPKRWTLRERDGTTTTFDRLD